MFTESVALFRRAGDLQNCCRCFIQLAALDLADENFEAAAVVLEEDLAICEDLEAPLELIVAWMELGETRMFQGRFEEAATWLRVALASCRRLGRRPQHAFPNLMYCVAQMGNVTEAARLAGAYDAICLAYGPPEEDGPAMANALAHLAFLRQNAWDEVRTYSRDALGDAEFQRLYGAGSKLTLDEAVDLALRIVNPQDIELLAPEN